jgi:NAD(P)-dependent dehydrogenase (short-subunit alcohol dehydrogenase family)
MLQQKVHDAAAELCGVAGCADDGNAARVEDGPQCGNSWIHESAPSITLPRQLIGLPMLCAPIIRRQNIIFGGHDMDGVAVVTGASSGIGEAIAQDLLNQGLTVVTLQRRPPRIKHERILFHEVDLADAAATTAVAKEVAAKYPVRYLVNNAGANRPGSLEQATIDDMDHVYALNVRAAMILIQTLVPGMRQAKFGRIVSISSRAILGKTQRLAYAAGKAGLVGMTRVLCLELAGDGITINAVAPGPVATELFDNGHPIGSAKRQAVIDSIPVKFVGGPKDVARAVSFFLSPDSGYISGQTLFVCGGSSISGSGGN